MHDSRTIRRVLVGLMIAAIVGMIAISGWLLWPEWRKFLIVKRLRRNFDSLTRNCDHDVNLHADVYDIAISRCREVKNVGGETLATEFLLPMLKHDCAKVRMYGTVFLEQIGPAAKDAIPSLIETLRDENAVVRLRAAYALPKFVGAAKAAVPALIDALQDDHSNVSEASARALRRIDSKIAVEFAADHAEDRHLSPKVVEILLRYDHDKVIAGKKVAF